MLLPGSRAAKGGTPARPRCTAVRGWLPGTHATKVRNQARDISSSLPTTSPGCSTKAIRRSSAIAKMNRLLAFQQKSLCRKQAEGAERDRSLVRDDGSNRPIKLLFSELNLPVRGCRHPADLSRGRGRHAEPPVVKGRRSGLGTLPHHRA
jgi:hypothetical protein